MARTHAETPTLSGAVRSLVKTINRYAARHGKPARGATWAEPLPPTETFAVAVDDAYVPSTLEAIRAKPSLAKIDRWNARILHNAAHTLFDFIEATKLTGESLITIEFVEGRVVGPVMFYLDQDLVADSQQPVLGLGQSTIENVYRSLLDSPPLRQILRISPPIREIASRLDAVAQFVEKMPAGSPFVAWFEELLNSRLCDRVRLYATVPIDNPTDSATGRWVRWRVVFAPCRGALLRELLASAAVAGQMMVEKNSKAGVRSSFRPPFGLALDLASREARRGNTIARFGPSEKAWLVLVELCRQHPGYCRAADLRNEVCPASDEHTISVHAGTVRKLIDELRLTVISYRGLGYRIEEKQPTSTLPKQPPARRRRKS